MLSLLTPRLRLILLAPIDLAALLRGELALRAIGVEIATDLVDLPVERAIRAKLGKMERAPAADHPWLSYWLMVLRSEDRGIGLLGFKGVPSEGEVEIGYGIVSSQRARGLTTEAAARLIEWAFLDPRCRAVTAVGVLEDNVASARVLAKLGMRRIRQDADRSDWRLDADGFPGRAR